MSAHGSLTRPGWTSVTVQLTPHSPVALAALAHAHGLSAPSRHAALAAAAPSSAAGATVEGFLIHKGLTVTARTAFSVTASGPAALVNSVFPAGTPIPVDIAHASRHVTSATAAGSPLVVPSALSGLASFVVGGADTSPVAHPLQVRASTTLARSLFTPAPITGTNARALYSVPEAVTTMDGKGITVATIQLSGWDDSNLATFAANAGLPNPVASGQYQAVSVDGQNPSVADGGGGDIEFALDQETLLSVAPKANQVAYVAPNTDQGFTDAFNAVASDALSHRAGLNFTALSVSWGDCEPRWSGGTLNAMDAAIQNVVAAGVTVFAASGDSGAFDCADGTLNVDYPASDPNVIAVGGLTTDPATKTETVWWGSSQGGGGGQSVYWTRPSWQNALNPTAAGTTLTRNRLVPDISLDADPVSGFRILAQGAWFLCGGTSLAAPLAAATLADVQIDGGVDTVYGLGNIASNLYAAPASFRDTTTGDNGHFPAGSGYDLASGLGAPQWSNLSSVLGLSVVGVRPSSSFTPIGPCRVFDTRTGTGTCPGRVPVPKAPVAAGHVLAVKVTGVGGVPANATAVVINLTAVGASTPTFVSAYPHGLPLPAVSNLNANNAAAVPNLAIVPVGLGGYIDLYNSSGKVNLLGDISGYFAPGPGSADTAVNPCRVFDTRTGTGTCPGRVPVPKAPVAAGHVLAVKVTGVGGVPANATAVVINLTAVGASTPTFVSAYPHGLPLPAVSNLNANNAAAVPNLAIVPVGLGGYIDLYNSSGKVNLLGDISGYFAPG
jgi:subtilase family serine protease